MRRSQRAAGQSGGYVGGTEKPIELAPRLRRQAKTSRNHVPLHPTPPICPHVSEIDKPLILPSLLLPSLPCPSSLSTSGHRLVFFASEFCHYTSGGLSETVLERRGCIQKRTSTRIHQLTSSSILLFLSLCICFLIFLYLSFSSMQVLLANLHAEKPCLMQPAQGILAVHAWSFFFSCTGDTPTRRTGAEGKKEERSGPQSHVKEDVQKVKDSMLAAAIGGVWSSGQKIE